MLWKNELRNFWIENGVGDELQPEFIHPSSHRSIQFNHQLGQDFVKLVSTLVWRCHGCFEFATLQFGRVIAVLTQLPYVVKLFVIFNRWDFKSVMWCVRTILTLASVDINKKKLCKSLWMTLDTCIDCLVESIFDHKNQQQPMKTQKKKSFYVVLFIHHSPKLFCPTKPLFLFRSLGALLFLSLSLSLALSLGFFPFFFYL